jgi:hypothetical protein
MTFNRLDTVKQVLQDKYFRWFDPIESEDVTQHPIVGGDGFGSGVSFGYEDGSWEEAFRKLPLQSRT